MNDERQTYDHLVKRLLFTFFNTLIFLTPFIFTWFNQELFEFNKMIFVYASTIIIVALWIIRMILARRLLFKRSRANFFVGLFLLSQILSTVFSMHPRTSFFGYYTRFNGGLLSTITYLALFYAMINNFEKKQLIIVYDNLILSAFLVSLYAIPEHFGHSMSCLIVAQRFDVSCWIQDVQNRVFATFGQPNWLATFLIMIIPLNISLLIAELSKKQAKFWQSRWQSRPILLSFSLMSMTLALLYSKSRSGFLALLLALAAYALFYLWQAKKKAIKTLLWPLTIIALTILLAGSPYSPSLKTLLAKEQNSVIETPTEESGIELGGSKSSEIRQVVWAGAIKVWQRYPILGSGVETFAYSYYQDRPVEHNLLSEWDFLYNKAHNELLNLLATSGIFGLGTYLLLFVAIAVQAFKIWHQRKNSLEILAISAALLAMFGANFLGFSTVNSNLLLAIFAASMILLSEKKNEAVALKAPLAAFEMLGSSLVLIVAVYLLALTFKIWQADFIFTNGKNQLAANNYQAGLNSIQEAIEKSPREALFHDELASNYSQLAVAFAKENKATESAQLAQAAIQSNDYVLQLNPKHLNFYKSRAKIFLRLGQLNENFYQYAKSTLLEAIELAPTDAKLYFNLALVERVLGDKNAAIVILEKTIQMKANYLQAREELAKLYLASEETALAEEQYHYILEQIDPKNPAAADYFSPRISPPPENRL